MEQVTASKSLLSNLSSGAEIDRDSINDRSLLLVTQLGQSAEDFRGRLKSYRKCSSKPVEVSPWWCSRYGWYCVGKDLLQCIGCRSYLSAHLPSAVQDVGLRRKAIDRFRALLIDAHDKTCVWRSEMTSEDACSPNVIDFDKAKEEFARRLRSLSQLFPVGGKRYAVGFDSNLIEEQELGVFMGQIGRDAFTPDPVSTDACVMALCGWRADDSCKESVTCEYCLRRIGLWLFRIDTGAESESNASTGTLESPQQQSTNKEKQLEPAQQHHKWCPWIMAASSSSSIFVKHHHSDPTGSTLTPTWLALLHLLNRRVGTDLSVPSQSFSQGEVSEHYVLARQLLDETLLIVDAMCENTEPSVVPEVTDPSIQQ